MVCRAVAGEAIETEVRGGIAPHRVSMVGVALRVVPLDQKLGTLQPVVVRLARDSRSRPGEVDGVEYRLVVVAVEGGHPGWCPIEVGSKEGPQHLPLLGVELPGRYAPGFDRVGNGRLAGPTQ